MQSVSKDLSQHGGITTATVITGPGPHLKLAPATQNCDIVSDMAVHAPAPVGLGKGLHFLCYCVITKAVDIPL